MANLPDDECCVWIPEVRPKTRRVSTMFHDTSCGRHGAATIGDTQPWNYCPFCARPLEIQSFARKTVRAS